MATAMLLMTVAVTVMRGVSADRVHLEEGFPPRCARDRRPICLATATPHCCGIRQRIQRPGATRDPQ
eukprot:528801-Pyramimonas_sp.AAC.1